MQHRNVETFDRWQNPFLTAQVTFPDASTITPVGKQACGNTSKFKQTCRKYCTAALQTVRSEPEEEPWKVTDWNHLGLLVNQWRNVGKLVQVPAPPQGICMALGKSLLCTMSKLRIYLQTLCTSEDVDSEVLRGWRIVFSFRLTLKNGKIIVSGQCRSYLFRISNAFLIKPKGKNQWDMAVIQIITYTIGKSGSNPTVARCGADVKLVAPVLLSALLGEECFLLR